MSSTEHSDAWPELATLDTQLRGDVEDLGLYRTALERGRKRLLERFNNHEPIMEIVRDQSGLVDGVLLRLWRSHADALRERVALVAVGGYGRAELHPGSDIDVMLLRSGRLSSKDKECIEHFLTALWDIGLEIGHSVRDIKECVREAKADITVATSLMESRLLHGERKAFLAMREKTGPDAIWPAKTFFDAKLQEQVDRHSLHNDTASNLEPNLKGAPGGLRDLQTIDWVAKRHFGTEALHQLVGEEFLKPQEYTMLSAARAFLWQLRFALHTLAGRREDRLLFDYQARIAEQLNYQDKPHSLGVEQLMQEYYRTAMRVTRLNEMLLQLFSEAILSSGKTSGTPFNSEFQISNGHLDVVDEQVFDRRPNALMEVFVHLQEIDNIEGITARTIRLLRQKRALIDDNFRADPENHKMFLRLLRAPRGVTEELRRMNRYGILGRFIPEFGRIVGLMQYDLFHAYTVDAHTLFVVSNLRRFSLSRFNHEFPYCSQIMQSLKKPELAYLAGLFHDIGKGRGGDHSQIGAVDAENFCLRIGIDSYDARLVAWLVRQHLTLSVTAQKKDIDDPDVIHEFSTLVRDDIHLRYLYVLTVADVRGTNPKMWNSWKASLFENLYRQTRRALDRGLENPIDREELIDTTRRNAMALIQDSGIADAARKDAWRSFDETYYLRHSADEISWHTQVLCEHEQQHGAVAAVRNLSNPNGGSLMVLAARAADSFPRVTAALEQLGLTILDARITNVANDFNLDTYRILGPDISADDAPARGARIEKAVLRAFAADATPKVTRTASRKVKIFSTPTLIEFATDGGSQHTVLEISAADRPGLLSRLGQAFVACDARVTAAKITTIGERAEDVFYLTNAEGGPLDKHDCESLEAKIHDLLPYTRGAAKTLAH